MWTGRGRRPLEKHGGRVGELNLHAQKLAHLNKLNGTVMTLKFRASGAEYSKDIHVYNLHFVVYHQAESETESHSFRIKLSINYNRRITYAFLDRTLFGRSEA